MLPSQLVFTYLHLPFFSGIYEGGPQLWCQGIQALCVTSLGWHPSTAPILTQHLIVSQLWTTPTLRAPWACGLRTADSSLIEAGHPEA